MWADDRRGKTIETEGVGLPGRHTYKTATNAWGFHSHMGTIDETARKTATASRE